MNVSIYQPLKNTYTFWPLSKGGLRELELGFLFLAQDYVQFLFSIDMNSFSYITNLMM